MSTLFVDLDGVLADFDAGYFQRFNLVADKVADTVDWDRVRDTPHFYRDLPPMHDAMDLWNAVKWLSPTILTGVPSSVPEALDNKREWVTRWLGDVPMIGCKSKDKSLHIQRPGDILIDDWEKYKHLWLERGGRWITHVSASESLKQLATLLRSGFQKDAA